MSFISFFKCHLFFDEPGSFILQNVTFWLIASWWCDLTCSSVPRVSWKLRSRGRIRVTFDFWPEVFVDGVVQPLLYQILMSTRLSFKDVTIDQWLALLFLMNSLLPFLFPWHENLFCKTSQ